MQLRCMHSGPTRWRNSSTVNSVAFSLHNPRELRPWPCCILWPIFNPSPVVVYDLVASFPQEPPCRMERNGFRGQQKRVLFKQVISIGWFTKRSRRAKDGPLRQGTRNTHTHTHTHTQPHSHTSRYKQRQWLYLNLWCVSDLRAPDPSSRVRSSRCWLAPTQYNHQFSFNHLRHPQNRCFRRILGKVTWRSDFSWHNECCVAHGSAGKQFSFLTLLLLDPSLWMFWPSLNLPFPMEEFTGVSGGRQRDFFLAATLSAFRGGIRFLYLSITCWNFCLRCLPRCPRMGKNKDERAKHKRDERGDPLTGRKGFNRIQPMSRRKDNDIIAC